MDESKVVVFINTGGLLEFGLYHSTDGDRRKKSASESLFIFLTDVTSFYEVVG